METILRKADHPINPLILNRWSPRAMSGESLSNEEIMSLFEAARWAPSCFNSQPWRFIYAKRETPDWLKFFDLLVAFNQSWCIHAALLGVVISLKHFEKNQKPSPTHSFDTGAAYENLSLEGTSRNLVIHAMEGFDYKRAREVLEIPNEYEVLAMFAAGKKGTKESLPKELQAKEVLSTRKKVAEIAFEGKFR